MHIDNAILPYIAVGMSFHRLVHCHVAVAVTGKLSKHLLLYSVRRASTRGDTTHIIACIQPGMASKACVLNNADESKINNLHIINGLEKIQ